MFRHKIPKQTILFSDKLKKHFYSYEEWNITDKIFEFLEFEIHTSGTVNMDVFTMLRNPLNKEELLFPKYYQNLEYPEFSENKKRLFRPLMNETHADILIMVFENMGLMRGHKINILPDGGFEMITHTSVLPDDHVLIVRGINDVTMAKVMSMCAVASLEDTYLFTDVGDEMDFERDIRNIHKRVERSRKRRENIDEKGSYVGAERK